MKGTRFFSTQPLVDNVVLHKRPIVEQEVVFWRAGGSGPKFGSVWCFGRICRPVFSVQLLGFLLGLPGIFFSWVCPCGSSYAGALVCPLVPICAPLLEVKSLSSSTPFALTRLGNYEGRGQ